MIYTDMNIDPTNTKNIFAKNLRLLMEKRNLSQLALAKLSGVDQSNISKMLHRRITPTLPALKALADALRVKITDLYPGPEKKPDPETIHREIKEADIDDLVKTARSLGFDENSIELLRILHKKKMSVEINQLIKKVLDHEPDKRGK